MLVADDNASGGADDMRAIMLFLARIIGQGPDAHGAVDIIAER